MRGLLQANTVAHLQCTSCQTWLMYSYGARSVKCAVCERVNAVHQTAMPGQSALPPGVAPPPGTTAAPPAAAAAPPASAAGPAAEAPVVVQNPSTVDEKGNEVRNGYVSVPPSFAEPCSSMHRHGCTGIGTGGVCGTMCAHSDAA